MRGLEVGIEATSLGVTIAQADLPQGLSVKWAQTQHGSAGRGTTDIYHSNIQKTEDINILEGSP